jgi:hypothetical protein
MYMYSTDSAYSVGNFSPALGARNQVGIGLLYRPTSPCSLASQFQTRFQESILRPIAGFKFPTQFSTTGGGGGEGMVNFPSLFCEGKQGTFPLLCAVGVSRQDIPESEFVNV